jgi:hypothetical protein
LQTPLAGKIHLIRVAPQFVAQSHEPCFLHLVEQAWRYMKKRILEFVALCSAIPTLLIAQTAPKTIAGVWVNKVVAKDVVAKDAPITLIAISLYSPDGSFVNHGIEKIPPMPEIPVVGTEMGPGIGQWVRTGDKESHMTFYAVLSKDGVAAGFYHDEATLILSDSGDEYTGESKAEFLDLKWKAVGGREANITAKRLKSRSRSNLNRQ